jgi:hypothetical protein
LEETCSGTDSTCRTGADLGEATYAVMIKPGEDVFLGGGRRFRVIADVPFDEEDESAFVGLLQIEAA